MCLICIEIAKSRMTVKEAREQLREMREGLEPGHVREVEVLLEETEQTQRD